MSMPLSQQAEERLGKSALVIIVEWVDDVALLIGQMVTMGVPEVVDRPMPRHWTQRGISWGWTAGMWLASMLTEGDHRKVAVATYIKGMQHTLSPLTAHVREPLDCRDDRLGHRLKHVSTSTYWHTIERDFNARSIEEYELPQDVSRCEATTVSGAHDVTAGGLGQCGPRKDAPTRPHITVMRGSLDPLGRPLATEVLSGARADDGFDMPVIDRLRAGLSTRGLLCVGDGKMRALGTRAPMAGHQHFSRSPLPLTGATAEAREAWITAGIGQDRDGELARMFRTNARGQEVRAAEGDAFQMSILRTRTADGDRIHPAHNGRDHHDEKIEPHKAFHHDEELRCGVAYLGANVPIAQRADCHETEIHHTECVDLPVIWYRVMRK